MPEINLCNEAGRDAVVNMENVTAALQVRWIDPDGRQAENVRVLKSTVSEDIEALRKVAEESSCEVSDLLVQGDPDVDLETVGSILSNTSRIYVDPEFSIVHKIIPYEVIKNPDGSERERRPAERTMQNVTGEMPLQWSGVYIKKSDVVRKFVFANKLQLTHINGLTYDFLYAIARELEERQSMLLLGAGPKSDQPLILRRGSVPYRGFLEGRTDGQRYLLILHLSNLELKTPTETEASDA